MVKLVLDREVDDSGACKVPGTMTSADLLALKLVSWSVPGWMPM
jgi:hypothetical protein